MEKEMNEDEIVAVLQNEMACVIRADQKRCNRDCAECDLVMPTEQIVEAYAKAINAVYTLKAIREIV